MKKIILASAFIVAAISAQPALAAGPAGLCTKGMKLCACGKLPRCGIAAIRAQHATVRVASPTASTEGTTGLGAGESYFSGSGMNSWSSPGISANFPVFHSSFASSMRSLRDETKFHHR